VLVRVIVPFSSARTILPSGQTTQELLSGGTAGIDQYGERARDRVNGDGISREPKTG